MKKISAKEVINISNKLDIANRLLELTMECDHNRVKATAEHVYALSDEIITFLEEFVTKKEEILDNLSVDTKE